MPPRKNQTFTEQQNIWIISNYEEFKSPTVLRREFRKHFKLSPRRLPLSYAFSRVINRYMASSDVSPSKFRGPSRTEIVKENIDRVRNFVKEKPNSSFSLPCSNSLPELVNTVEGYAASLNKDQIITPVNDILPRAQACIKSDRGAFEYKLRSFKKRLIH